MIEHKQAYASTCSVIFTSFWCCCIWRSNSSFSQSGGVWGLNFPWHFDLPNKCHSIILPYHYFNILHRPFASPRLQ